MPDHLHLLVAGSLPFSDCRQFIARAKQFSGYYYKRNSNSVFGSDMGSNVLRADEDTFRVARYILENPLRAGLARSVREYPYLGSSCYTIDQILDALHTSG